MFIDFTWVLKESALHKDHQNEDREQGGRKSPQRSQTDSESSRGGFQVLD
jgi:hypothetical protein